MTRNISQKDTGEDVSGDAKHFNKGRRGTFFEKVRLRNRQQRDFPGSPVIKTSPSIKWKQYDYLY